MKRLNFLLFIILISCVEKDNVEVLKTNTKFDTVPTIITHVKDSLSIEKLMLLTKNEAIKKYGTPSSIEQFILDDAQGEFRVSISSKYTREERQNESILIDEITWKNDQNTWITVWYEVQKEKAIPKDILLWEKGSEF